MMLASATQRSIILSGCKQISSARSLTSAIKPMIQSKRGNTAIRASNNSFDFDALLNDVANKFEKADNKPAIIGWTSAAFGAIVVAEWFIHLPLINLLVGFPIQLLGLVTAGNLYLKYYVEKNGTPTGDAEELVKKVTSQLPGL